jgi:hypothetical protein
MNHIQYPGVETHLRHGVHRNNYSMKCLVVQYFNKSNSSYAKFFLINETTIQACERLVVRQRPYGAQLTASRLQKI